MEKTLLEQLVKVLPSPTGEQMEWVMGLTLGSSTYSCNWGQLLLLLGLRTGQVLLRVDYCHGVAAAAGVVAGAAIGVAAR
jgi:hypothetical protein